MTNKQIYAHNFGMRRKPGTLVPLEHEILKEAIRLQQQGVDEFYGFLIRRQVETVRKARSRGPFRTFRSLVGYGTLYRALDRLCRLGFLDRYWENPETAAARSGLRRRYYRLTNKGSRFPSEISRGGKQCS